MSAVVRVKRRIDEEPLGSFIINGKKRRLDDEATTSSCGDGAAALPAGGKEEFSTMLKFAGTIQSQDDDAISKIARLSKDEAKELVQQKSRKVINHTERARQEMRQSLHENRFRVVNCLRTTLGTVDEGEDVNGAIGGNEPKEITIVDIEKHSEAEAATDGDLATNTETSTITSSQSIPADLPQPSNSDLGYVYDLYLPENEQQALYVDFMDNLSFRLFDDFSYEERFCNYDEDVDYDSEDSNEEDYYRNDYPDEDEDEDEGEGNLSGCFEVVEDASALRREFANFTFGDDDEETDKDLSDVDSEESDEDAYGEESYYKGLDRGEYYD